MHQHYKHDKHDKHDKHGCPKMQYARAYIRPQIYENLFSVDEALCRGTIFKDLYMPYREPKNK